jgi:hypothetical protein
VKRILQSYHLVVSLSTSRQRSGRTNDGSDVTDDGSLGGVETGEPLGRLKVHGVEILTSMGEEVEPYHQLPSVSDVKEEGSEEEKEDASL